ncbi:hypothetical protein [Luteipulveratus flavus]|uniref:Heavy metal transporter n=1 Tax=Luteipulveratus flavus TaxID=3031728 RepID=A0ABT6C9K1_9MICO|nr:hypothetical protein [Luteipulveratus sp. YIM 133296]MDF8264987.1 hypothetical protein [Luteipulveratus sp. YIM 133296]
MTPLPGSRTRQDEAAWDTPQVGNTWDEQDFEEHRGRGRWRKTVGCLVPLLVLGAVGYGGYVAYDHLENFFGGTSCRMVDGGHEEKWEPEQAANASTITTVAVTLDRLPTQAAHIAVTTAIQESKLRNLTYGDRDSVGLFQQRPSQGWGTADQIADPVYSSRAFYEHLVKVDGWRDRPLTEVAQEVQRSGHPDAYADHEDQGRTITQVLSGQVPAAVGCRLDAATDSTAPAALLTKLRAQTGARASVAGGGVDVRASSEQVAWAIAGWAVTHSESDGITKVTVGDQEWRRERGKDGWRWHEASTPTNDTRSVRIDLA